MKEEHLLNHAYVELRSEYRHKPTWEKALADCEGDENKAEPTYVLYRAEHLKKRIKPAFKWRSLISYKSFLKLWA